MAGRKRAAPTSESAPLPIKIVLRQDTEQRELTKEERSLQARYAAFAQLLAKSGAHKARSSEPQRTTSRMDGHASKDSIAAAVATLSRATGDLGQASLTEATGVSLQKRPSAAKRQHKRDNGETG